MIAVLEMVENIIGKVNFPPKLLSHFAIIKTNMVNNEYHQSSEKIDKPGIQNSQLSAFKSCMLPWLGKNYHALIGAPDI